MKILNTVNGDVVMDRAVAVDELLKPLARSHHLEIAGIILLSTKHRDDLIASEKKIGFKSPEIEEKLLGVKVEIVYSLDNSSSICLLAHE